MSGVGYSTDPSQTLWAQQVCARVCQQMKHARAVSVQGGVLPSTWPRSCECYIPEQQLVAWDASHGWYARVSGGNDSGQPSASPTPSPEGTAGSATGEACGGNDAAEYTATVQSYEVMLGLALGLNVLLLVVFVVMRARIHLAPAARQSNVLRWCGRAFMSVGFIQLCLSVGFFSALYPDCPEGCTCTGPTASISYMCAGLGCLWLMMGSWFERAAKAAAYMQLPELMEDDDDGDDPAIYMLGQGEMLEHDPLDPPPAYTMVIPDAGLEETVQPGSQPPIYEDEDDENKDDDLAAYHSNVTRAMDASMSTSAMFGEMLPANATMTMLDVMEQE